MHAICWSFAQFCMSALSYESTWRCLSVIRSYVVAILDGGLRYVCRALLQSFFFADVMNLATAGLHVRPLGAAPMFLFAVLT